MVNSHYNQPGTTTERNARKSHAPGTWVQPSMQKGHSYLQHWNWTQIEWQIQLLITTLLTRNGFEFTVKYVARSLYQHGSPVRGSNQLKSTQMRQLEAAWYFRMVWLLFLDAFGMLKEPHVMWSYSLTPSRLTGKPKAAWLNRLAETQGTDTCEFFVGNCKVFLMTSKLHCEYPAIF